MRLQLISVIFFFALMSPVAAQQAANPVATGAVNAPASGGRSQLRSSSVFNGRESLRVPSHRAGGQRDVGANFEARNDTNLSAASRRSRVRASLDANAKAHHPRHRDEGTLPNGHLHDDRQRFESGVAAETNRHVLHADLQLAHRLAAIDRLRDHALANDDVDLLLRADVLEQQARVHHQQHVQHMQMAAEQGRGQKNGFWVDGSEEIAEPGQGRLAHAVDPVLSREHEEQFDASGAAYVEPEPSHEMEVENGSERGADQRQTRKPWRKPFPRYIPGVSPMHKGRVDGASSSRAELTEDRQPASRPRRTPVMEEEYEGELDVDFELEGPVRPARASN